MNTISDLFVACLYLETEKSYFETRKKLDEWMVVLTIVGWSFSFFSSIVLPITNEVNELKKYKFDTAQAQLSMFVH